MADPVELLDRVIKIADRAITPAPDIKVPERTLRELALEVEGEWRKPCVSADERVIGDECSMLVQCLLNAELHDGDIERVTRWRTLAKCFLPFLRTDLVRAGRQVLR